MVKDIANAEKAAERAAAKTAGLKGDLEALDTSVRVLGIDILGGGNPDEEDVADQGAPLVKELVLKALEDSYPAPMRAADVKTVIENEIGRTVHDKTPGMTLYRLSKEKLVHREGRDWFFVPQKSALDALSDAVIANASARSALNEQMAQHEQQSEIDQTDPGDQGPPDDEDRDWRD